MSPLSADLDAGRTWVQLPGLLDFSQRFLRTAKHHEKCGVPMVGYHRVRIQLDGPLEFTLRPGVSHDQ